ncbi:hypothetical protein CHS0354_016616 [Potamilus streckersoni]|uniref:Uncharacterized protein n=1 Tax=Potamilus streckersoni TaxID=2493646 RepID=A0AAE0WDQ4_9BIVA|nr:hypothetical protein CHS0354_016616 [Potamilus streckersoni]
MALKLKAMRSLGLNLPKSPDAFIKEQDTNEKVKETLETGLPDMVKYTQWKKVVEGQKSRWKEVDEAVAKTDFIHLMDSQTSEFRNHVKRGKVQYQEIRNLRENLPENEVMLWMDFAENFVCTSVEAVQSLYWNQAMADVDMSNEIIQQEEKPMQISGTFKLHAIMPINSCTILTRETSCYCNGCLVNPQTSVHEWQEHVMCRRQYEEVTDTDGTLVPTLEDAAITSDQEEVFEYEHIQYSDI